jgi:hypothetical protein
MLTIERQYSVQMNAVKSGRKGFLGSRDHGTLPSLRPPLPKTVVSVSLPPHFGLSRTPGLDVIGETRLPTLRRSRFHPLCLVEPLDLEPSEELREERHAQGRVGALPR